MHRLLNRFRFSRCGAALIEFAFVAPLLLLLLFGGIEVSRYIMISQRVEKAGYTLDDILTQYTAAQLQSPGTLDSLFAQYKTMVNPFGNDANQRVIFTSVTKQPASYNPPYAITIDWQKTGGGTLTNAQTVSIVDGINAGAINGSNPPPNLVADFSGNAIIKGQLDPGQSTGMPVSENMIVAEVYYQYQPIASGILHSVGLNIGETTLSRRMFMRPRNGPLNNLSTCAGGSDSWDNGMPHRAGPCAGTYGQLNSGDNATVTNTTPNYTGSETATCNQGTVTFANMVCINTPPVNGACGAANGGTYNTAADVNNAGLCGAGTPNPSQVSGNSPWSWVCKGSNGGTDSPPCSASGIPCSWVVEAGNNCPQGGYCGFGVLLTGTCADTCGSQIANSCTCYITDYYCDADNGVCYAADPNCSADHHGSGGFDQPPGNGPYQPKCGSGYYEACVP